MRLGIVSRHAELYSSAVVAQWHRVKLVPESTRDGPAKATTMNGIKRKEICADR